MTKSLRIGTILVRRGLATDEQINEALRIQVGGNRRLGYILIKMGLISSDQLLEILSAQLGLPIINIEDEFSSDVKSVLPRYLCQKYTVTPLSKSNGNILNLAMVDPSDDSAIADIESYTGMVVKPLLAKENNISAANRKLIPFTIKDIFNPQVYDQSTKIASSVAMLLLIIIGIMSYNYIQIERYGSISTIGDTITFKNHDLIIGVEGSGKISLLGHGAYSKGFYAVSFNSNQPLLTFIDQKRSTFSNKQYEWLMRIIKTKLADRQQSRTIMASNS